MSNRKDTKPMDGYKTRLLDAKAMMGQSGLAIYDRIAILLEVYNDKDFRTDHGNIDDHKAAEVMDGYLSDLAFGFLQLRSLREHYPARSQWETGRLRLMWNEMLKAKQATDAKFNTRRSYPAARESVSFKDHQVTVDHAAALEAKCKRIEREQVEVVAKAAKLNSELEERDAKIATLEAEVKRLTMKVESLTVQLRAARQKASNPPAFAAA